jgi:hypothetical protein
MLKNEYILKEKCYYKKNSKLRIKKKKKRERGENIVNFYYIGTML